MTSRLQVELDVDLAGHPLVGEFGKKSGDQARSRILDWENAGHSGSPAPRPVDTLQDIGVRKRVGWTDGKSYTVRFSGTAVSAHSARSLSENLPHQPDTYNMLWQLHRIPTTCCGYCPSGRGFPTPTESGSRKKLKDV